MSEAKDLAKDIINFLNREGWKVWQNNSGAVVVGSRRIHLSPTGYGDIIGHDALGRFVNIEIKIGEDALTDEQAEVLYVLSRSKHGICCVAKTWDDFAKWFYARRL